MGESQARCMQNALVDLSFLHASPGCPIEIAREGGTPYLPQRVSRTAVRCLNVPVPRAFARPSRTGAVHPKIRTPGRPAAQECAISHQESNLLQAFVASRLDLVICLRRRSPVRPPSVAPP